jgi:transposase
VQAPAPAQAIDGGMVTEAFLAYIAVMKYAYHMPLYRLAQMLARSGSRSTTTRSSEPYARSDLARRIIYLQAVPVAGAHGR